MQECRLAADDLACRRGDRVLFRGLSLELVRGSALHVAGANGIGKSSLLRILAGLLRPMSGTVTAQGTVALLDERPALDLAQPLGKALAFWRRIDGPPPGEALAQLDLAALEQVPVRYLSTGQRKRAALARVLGQGADIWVLDEPLNGLDTRAQGVTEALCADFLGRGGIIVAASHQPFALPGCRTLDLAEYAG